MSPSDYVRSLIAGAIAAIDDPVEAVAAAEEVFAAILREAEPGERRAAGAVLVDRAVRRIEGAAA